MIYVFDVDGTLSDCSHRLPLIGADPVTHVSPKDAPGKDWEAFYAACIDDAPLLEVITVERALWQKGNTIVLSTGRPERYREATSRWLAKYRVEHHGMYMRKDNDHREDYVIKEEILDLLIGRFSKKIDGAFEDRQQVVDMYRKRGIRVFQVDKGAF